MTRSWNLIAFAILAWACGNESPAEEQTPLPTSVVLTVRDLERLGPVEGSIDNEPFDIIDQEALRDCLEPEYEVEEAGETLHVIARSTAGFRWDFEVPIEPHACNEIELSLDNVSTAIWGCLPADEETGSLEAFVDGRTSAPTTQPVSDEAFLQLEASSGGDLRRALFELADAGMASVFHGEPGRYMVRCDRPGSTNAPESKLLWDGYVGYTLKKIFIIQQAH